MKRTMESTIKVKIVYTNHSNSKEKGKVCNLFYKKLTSTILDFGDFYKEKIWQKKIETGYEQKINRKQQYKSFLKVFAKPDSNGYKLEPIGDIFHL